MANVAKMMFWGFPMKPKILNFHPAIGETMGKFQELINGEKPVLVDFYADWCGPCKMMAPILQELAGKIEGKASIIKVDVDKNQQAAAAYQVQGVPTLILFKQGKVVWRQSGVVPVNQLENLIHQFA